LRWVDAAFLLDADVDDSALPLWPGVDPDMLMMTADPAAALATGLSFRPLAATIRDTLAWTRTVEQPEKSGLSAADETALLEKWQAQRRV
jgi:2'-hydroxyisoflavone reductase